MQEQPPGPIQVLITFPGMTIKGPIGPIKMTLESPQALEALEFLLKMTSISYSVEKII